jgi:predicted AlkP superfamily pyrophosphatase or phosphodiesterase
MKTLAAAILIAGVAGSRLPDASAASPAGRHLLLVSIDGLMPVYYQEAERLGLRIPNLRRLMAGGVSARVLGVLPTVTYPSHTTLITGVPPRLHGIGTNSLFDPLGVSNQAWRWYAQDVRKPTLVSAARAAGLTTAAVSWPVSVGLQADFNLPEFWRTGSEHPDDLRLIELLATPGLVEAVARRRGRPFGYPIGDDERTDTALHLIEAHRPHVLLLHLVEADSAQHRCGPGSPEAKVAVEAADQRLGRVLAALTTAGIAEGTLVAVVSDHGFLPVTHELRPNAVLREAGLLSVDAEGKVKQWRAWFHVSGGSAALQLREGEDAGLASQVRALFEPRLRDAAQGLHALLDASAIERLGGAAGSALVLDARSGFYFTADASGPWSAPAAQSVRGYHGHAPDRPEMQAALLMAGSGVMARGDLGVVPMTSIAPTLARYLGLSLAPEASPPLPVLAAPAP